MARHWGMEMVNIGEAGQFRSQKKNNFWFCREFWERKS